MSANAPVWRRFPELEVREARNRLALLGEAWGAQTYVIPLFPNEAARCPHFWWMLRPDRRSIAALADKAAFARYVRSHGLAALTPRTFLPGEEPAFPKTWVNPARVAFPAVAKPARGTGGVGIEVVEDRAALAALLAGPARRRQHWVFQELLSGHDHVTHAVAVQGRLVWHRSYRYQLKPGERIQTEERVLTLTPFEADPRYIELFERFTAPFAYDGPLNFNYKLVDGRPVVMEINPRLGGSLLRPENLPDLQSALAVTLAHARRM